MIHKKFMHGNKARISPAKNVIPLFSNCATNDYITRDGTVFHRNDGNVELAKHEVDNITKL
jgi:hypothetical protein